MMKAGRPSYNREKALDQLQAIETVKFGVNLPKELHKRIKMFAIQNDMTITTLLIEALEKYMAKDEK